MSAMNRTTTFTVMESTAMIIVTFSMIGPVVAQTSADAPVAKDQASDNSSVSVSKFRREEIIVTVRKVEENLKDVPLSITAFDANVIEEARIRSLQDVADLTPGLSFFNAAGETLPVPIIRGIAQTDIFGETNAAVFVDGVYVAGREGLNFSQLDLERIEVVKGPQSALYGRTAFSGALNYITKRPNEEFESKVEIEAGNRGKQRGTAMISGPIFGKALRGRIAALYDDWDGSYDNTLAPENDIGGARFRSFQGGLVWQPTDNFEVYGNMYVSNDEIDDAVQAGVSANCENRIDENEADVRLLNLCGKLPTLDSIPSPGPGAISKDSLPVIAGATGENRDLKRATLNITWDLDFGSFTALTGYSDTEHTSFTDFGHLGELPFLYCTGATVEPPGVPNSCGSNPSDQQFFASILNENRLTETEEISQEIRFSSSQDQAFRYTVGAYGYSSKQSGFGGFIVGQTPLPDAGLGPGVGIGLAPFPAEAPNFALGTAIFYCSFTDDGCLDPLRRKANEKDTESWAVFTGIDYDFTDRLTGRGEIRYTKTTTDVDAFNYTLCTPTGLDPACEDDWFDLRIIEPLSSDQSGGSISGTSNSDSVTGRLGLDFKINDGWMMYGSIATGDKPAGIQAESTNVIVEGGTEIESFVHTFDTEKLIAYELGLKGRTEDGRIGFDAAVYFNDWQDIVLLQTVNESPASGRPLELPEVFPFNAGTAEVIGFEVTADTGFTENFSARITLNWNDSTMKDALQDTFVKFPTFAPDGNVSGNKLLRQPEWMGSVSLNYARSLWGSWKGFARIDANYQSKVFVGNDNQGWLGARTITNLRFGADTRRFSLSFWVRNLFENDEPAAAFRDIFFTNTDSITPPFANLGPRPSFDKFVPIRNTISFPNLRTYGFNATVRFGAAAR